jgi:uncharacterized membrane protein YbhN (UPF0104 family)
MAAVTGCRDGRHQPSTRARTAEAAGSQSSPTLMVDDSPFATGDSHWRRWAGRSAALVLSAAAVFFALPALAGVPAQLARGRATWIAAAGALELFSAVGFVLVFKLVFAARDNWRRTLPAALRALGASTVFPGGGVIGPGTGAWSIRPEKKPSLAQLTRSTTTFVILTNAPGAVALAATGVLLALGVSNGPRQTALTILPAIAVAGLLTATWVAARDRGRQPQSPHRRLIARALATPAVAMSGGTRDARALIVGGNWKLSGALGYYAFDNAVLWAAFHTFGHTPPLSVVVMGYVVGSLAGALPLPAGLGAVDAGLIGALILYGSPAAQTAAAVLLYRAISLSVPVALGAIGWTYRPGGAHARRGSRARRRATPDLVTAHVESS